MERFEKFAPDNKAVAEEPEVNGHTPDRPSSQPTVADTFPAPAEQKHPKEESKHSEPDSDTKPTGKRKSESQEDPDEPLSEPLSSVPNTTPPPKKKRKPADT